MKFFISKKTKFLEIFFLFISIYKTTQEIKNKNSFDTEYKNCKITQCNGRNYHESCIFKCMSAKCYAEIYNDYLLEFGQTNYEKKSNFQICYNKINI